jgi:hypothetical protein
MAAAAIPNIWHSGPCAGLVTEDGICLPRHESSTSTHHNGSQLALPCPAHPPQPEEQQAGATAATHTPCALATGACLLPNTQQSKPSSGLLLGEAGHHPNTTSALSAKCTRPSTGQHMLQRQTTGHLYPLTKGVCPCSYSRHAKLRHTPCAHSWRSRLSGS